MQELIMQLIEIQTLDNRIAELQKSLSNVPEYLIDAEQKMKDTELKYSDLSKNLEKTKSEKNELENRYEENKAFLEKAQKKLSTVKNNKEYEAVLKELDQLKKNINEDELKLVELSESFEKLTSEYSGAEEEINKTKNDYEEKAAKKIEDDSNMQKEFDEITAKRQELASKIKKSVFSRYERVRQARNNLAIVRVDKETCSGCYMKIPPQLYVDVKKNKDLLQCPNCQRFLYYKEEEEI